jgi:tRNA(fMet)-specific endonuclease VapC
MTSSLYLLDTKMVTYIARGRSRAARGSLAGLLDHEVACISAITEGEIRHGLAKAPQAHSARSAMEAFLGYVRILPWGSGEAIVYGMLRAKLARTGRTVEALDLLIAAHAIARNATLVTSDKVFQQVDDLRLTINWATDL